MRTSTNTDGTTSRLATRTCPRRNGHAPMSWPGTLTTAGNTSRLSCGVLRRLATTVGKIQTYALYFKGYHRIEHVHPLEGGVLRLKSRHERRPHLPVERAWLFYPRYFAETVLKA